jgi:hypothetical protein
MLSGKKILMIPILATVLATPSAFAKVRVSLAGGVGYGLSTHTATVTSPLDPSLSSSTEVKGALGFGGGLLLELPLGKSTGFELAAFYLSRGSKVGDTTTSAGWLHMPAGFRFWFSPRTSLLLGGYYDTILEETTGDKTTYGLTGGLRFMLGKSFFFEPRFNYGLQKLLDKNPMEALGLIGFTFGK